MDTQPMSLKQIVQGIQLNTLNDPTLPASNSQEFLIAFNFIKLLGIPTWENERDVLWNELWVDQPNFATITADTTTISLPTDFKFMGGGIVRLVLPNSTSASPAVITVPVKKLEEIELNPSGSRREFYVTGNIVQGFQLVLGWTPQAGDVEIGAAVSFRYYKFAAMPSNVNDATWTPEMSDPSYIVYKVSAAISRNNYNMNLYQVNEDLANYSLLNMRTGNDMATNFEDNYVKDIDGLLGQRGGRAGSRYHSGFWINGGY